MGKGLFSQQTHHIILLVSFVLIAIGMPSTKVLMSFGLVFAIANWFLQGNFKYKFQQIKENTLLQVLILFYLLLILGLIWSWDITQGLKDIKSRLPLLALPLIVGTSKPFSKKEIVLLLQLFLASLFVTSLYNVLYFNNVIGQYISDDIRGLSRFASHIRYALLIALGFGIAVWLQFLNKRFSFIYTFLALWFTAYTIYSQVLSGTIAYCSIVVLGLFYLLYNWKKWAAFTLCIALVGFFSIIIGYLFNISKEKIDCSTLPSHTKLGYEYNHNCRDFSEFNGKAILAYYSEMEMYIWWGVYSETNFMGLDKKGQMMRMTAARYMTSLGLTKDAEGLKQLTPQDIRNIEDGYSYRNERNEIFMPRIYGLKYQIINRSEPNGHSLLQRLEHWKAANYIIKHHGLLGVGTGGNQKAFNQAYNKIDSPLKQENRLRSHNQFLAFFVSYGLLGFISFMILLGFSFYIAWKSKSFLALMFLAVITTSFLIEDTLETQLGVTIFGFFMSFLVLKAKEFANVFAGTK